LDVYSVKSPQAIISKAGNLIEKVKGMNNCEHYVRLVTFLDGIPMGRAKYCSDRLFSKLGSYMGRLDNALYHFDHPAFHRRFQWDLLTAPQYISEHIDLISNRRLKDLIAKISTSYRHSIVPLYPHLRKSVIHNDVNDYNLIISQANPITFQENEIVGAIDYGDAIYSFLVSDLAVCIAYAILNKPDPLKIARDITGAYHKEFSLNEIEISALFGMICMRLCLSLCLGAYQSRQRPRDAYLSISKQPIMNTLPNFANLPPQYVEGCFRQVCGYSGLKKTWRLNKWLCANEEEVFPLLGQPISSENTAILDLSVSSSLITIAEDKNSKPRIQNHALSYMDLIGKPFGISPPYEPRINYELPPFTEPHVIRQNGETIHLGVDLFSITRMPVFAPLSGRIHVLDLNEGVNNKCKFNQLILEHNSITGGRFFTRYCNIEIEPANLMTSQCIEKGAQIGWFGSCENPFLTIQLISDLLDLDSTFPIHVLPNQLDIWRWFALNPATILRIPNGFWGDQRITKSDTYNSRKKFLGGNLSIGYRNPLKIERGWMQYLFDETGRKYLDAYNNVPHVGHCHPAVVQAAKKQLSILNTNTRYLHDMITTYAEKILETLPPPLGVCYFVNSGSEANELALRLARAYTQQKDLIVLESAYHGNTTSLIDISPYKHDGPGGYPTPSWVHTIPLPDLYRGLYRSSDPHAVNKYVHHLELVISQLEMSNVGLSGFIAETCPSVGGQIFLPNKYLEKAYKLIRAAGGVCIADEVQTGFGRIGTNFYAFEAHKVIPDILVLGKPIGNGHPLGAVITTNEIADAFDNGMEFFSTFGGNPVSCAIGLSVLDVVISENLQMHAQEVGQTLMDGLIQLMDGFHIVGDVRGSGLFIGVELVVDRKTRLPATQEANFIVNKLRESGILLGTDGPDHNVLKIRPPMPFNVQNGKVFLDRFEHILDTHFS
jgi:4-aminobutyrate aminotransferase-like enzyme/Ser/Thr protein kinase RdoA (MazF antagonist)